ncbi:MAG: cell wall-binding repeat-containing protein [Rhodoglobus sp.]
MAHAVSGDQFDPGYIISDTQFYDRDAMSESDIQAFLNARGPATCRPGYTCLKDYTFTTFTKAANPMCAAYTGAASETVARIIWKVSQACGISPRVLLVMLQKEQGLITDDWPTAGQLAAAMGAGCPDTAACDPAQAGFYQQVYLAAYYLIRYGGPPGTGPGTPYTSDFSRYGPGKTVAVQYHPNAACGTSAVYIRNQPTGSLYTYTPYTPNAAALANLGADGDACSSYGNRNFWWLYNIWFGDPTAGIEGVTVSRISGADRYDVGVAISRQSFPDPAAVPVVYVTTGVKYPDALSAAPAATLLGGPLLLTPGEYLDSRVSAEIQRLHPARIVVVGGPASVSDLTYTQLEALVGPDAVSRVGGADRYEASRNIVAGAFTAPVSVAYVATGANFPDALSASAAGGALGRPVILVQGTDSRLDQATRGLLEGLAVSRIIVAGGPNSVSDGILADLNTIAPTSRMSGADRFDASRAIAMEAFSSTTPETVYIATGFNFPDALAGAAIAGRESAPLIVVPGNCVPAATLDAIRTLGVGSVTLLGGTATLTANVQYLVRC